MERILCAAIWYKDIPLKKVFDNVLPINCDKGLVVCGHRHGQCMWTMGALTGLRSVQPEVGDYTQGFLTNKNRFVDRFEGAHLAKIAGQVAPDHSAVQLYSEDLY